MENCNIVIRRAGESEDELMHYGVKGMRWGVRKDRVTVTTQHRVGDYYTDKEQQKMTKRAVKIYSDRRATSEALAKSNRNAEERHYRKANMEKAEEYKRRAEAYMEQANMYSKHINDIATGTIKAGRDYVVNSEYSTSLLLDAVGFINVRRKDIITYN